MRDYIDFSRIKLLLAGGKVDYFIDKDEQFVIRAKSNRDVLFKDKSINILKLANKYKGKYTMIIKNKAGKAKKCKFSFIPISLPAIPDKKLTLVVVRGFSKKPMMLISNVMPNDKRLTLAIVAVLFFNFGETLQN